MKNLLFFSLLFFGTLAGHAQCTNTNIINAAPEDLTFLIRYDDLGGCGEAIGVDTVFVAAGDTANVKLYYIASIAILEYSTANINSPCAAFPCAVGPSSGALTPDPEDCPYNYTWECVLDCIIEVRL